MNKIIKRLKSRTYQVAFLGTVLTAIEVNSGLLSTLMPEGYRAWAIMFWPAAMMLLREVTTTALKDK